MRYFKIERPSDGFVAVVQAPTPVAAVRQFEEQYEPELYVDETDAEVYREFRRDADNDVPWYS